MPVMRSLILTTFLATTLVTLSGCGGDPAPGPTVPGADLPDSGGAPSTPAPPATPAPPTK
jgi:hypothetical protein